MASTGENTNELNVRYKNDVLLGGRADKMRAKTKIKRDVFKTTDKIEYEDPNMTHDEATVDKFIIKCLIIADSEEKKCYIEKHRVFELFEKFCKLNDVKLQLLDPSRAKSNRQGELVNIITALTGVETGRPSDHEKRTPSYYNVQISTLGRYLETIDSDLIKKHS